MAKGNFWSAVTTLVGTIIGVGIFALPYVAWHAGFFVGALYLLALFFVFIAVHLMFGEVILRTAARHRLVGYVTIYCGARAGRAVMATTLAGVLGGMMVYLIVGGQFTHVLFGGFLGSPAASIALFWALCAPLVLLGLGAVKRSEFIMSFCIAAMVLALFFLGAPRMRAEHFFTFDVSNLFLPYGVTLFTLAGTAAIPSVRDILRGSEGVMKKAIVAGTAIAAALSFLFVVTVVGVSGPATSEDALSGLQNFLGTWAVTVGAVFGLFLIATSYIIFGLYLKDTLSYDIGMPRFPALFLVTVAPLALTMLESDGFIKIIGLLGAVIGGIEALFLIAAYLRAREKGDRTPEYALAISRPVIFALAFLFIAGVAYALASEWRYLLSFS